MAVVTDFCEVPKDVSPRPILFLDEHKLAWVVADIHTNQLERCRSDFVERGVELTHGCEELRIIVQVPGESIAPLDITLLMSRFKQTFYLLKELQHVIISKIA